jgi:hypothetical protein
MLPLILPCLLALLLALAVGRLTGTSFTDFYSDKVLNVFRATNITAPATIYTALFKVLPTDTAASGTEAAYTGYGTRPSVTFGAPAANTPSGRIIKNTAAVNFPTNTGAAETEVGFAFFDASTVGNNYCWASLDSSITINTSQTKGFDVADLSIATD